MQGLLITLMLLAVFFETKFPVDLEKLRYTIRDLYDCLSSSF